MHIMRMDDLGQIIWEQEIDLATDDRLLDITEGPNGSAAFTGYTNAPGTPTMYVGLISINGNLTNETLITGLLESAGTNIIYAQSLGAYVVGGTSADQFSLPFVNSGAVLVKLDASLNVITQNTLAGPNQRHCAINDILELPDGLFVTGSIDFQCGGSICQGVLATFINQDMGIIQDLSFQAATGHHGASAVYLENLDQIFLLTNNVSLENPQIVIISDALSATWSSGITPSASIYDSYALNVDLTNSSNLLASGFKLEISPNYNNYLIATGYFKGFGGNNTFGTGEADCWIAEFQCYDGNISQPMVYDIPSIPFSAQQLGDAFAPRNGASPKPYIFTPEIATLRNDGSGMVFLAQRNNDGNFALDIVSTPVNRSSECMFLHKQLPIPTPIPTAIPVLQTIPNGITSTANSNITTPRSGIDQLCRFDESRSFNTTNETVQEVLSKEASIFPNPASNVLTVQVENDEEIQYQLELFNALGKKVLKTTYFSSSEVTLHIEDLQPGVYFIEIINSKGQIKRDKFTKQ